MIEDLLAGIAHNLLFAERHGYEFLYRTLIERLEKDYYDPIAEHSFRDGVQAKLKEIQAIINNPSNDARSWLPAEYALPFN